ncbi:hypothetical protein BGZ93_003070, partial [Podila epicladia]
MNKSTTITSTHELSSFLLEGEQPITTTDSATGSSKKQTPPGKTTPRHLAKERVTKQEFILTWLEHVPNFTSVFDSGGQTTVGKSNKSRSHEYATLVEAVSKQSKGRLNITGKNMRERFQRHMKVYTKTKTMALHTGFGVTEEDSRNEICTVAHKLESMCTCYARMDILFGRQPNVTPLAQVCRGVPTEEQDEQQEPSN